MPEAIQDWVDELGHGQKLIAASRVRRNGRDLYRVTVGRTEAERIALLTDKADELRIEDIRPSETAAYRDNPDRWYRDSEDRIAARERAASREAERVTATVDKPDRIDLDQVPVAARATFMREAAGDKQKLGYIICYRDTSKNVLYQCSIPDSNNTAHMVQVLADGRIFNEGEYANGGQRVADQKARTVGYRDLPDRIRETVDQEAPRGRIPHVDVARRGGRDIYTVQIDDRDRTRYLTISDEGKVLSDVSERATVEDRDSRRGE